jgi:hypothetical protein
MRSLPMIGITFSAAIFLAACSSASSDSPPTASPPSTCASKTQDWLHGQGGADFRAALSAASAVRFSIASSDHARLDAVAKTMNTAARRAYSDIPPNCGDPGSNYRLGMGAWVTGAVDATSGNVSGSASQLAKGAHEISLVAVLKGSVRNVTVPVLVKTTPTSPPASPVPTTPAEPPTTSAPAPAPVPTTPAPAPSTAAATPAGCYPISDEGTCYEPGEYCRDDDHGTSGVAGDGESITCEDNDGWRWEPV